jgi:hypothetical protein
MHLEARLRGEAVLSEAPAVDRLDVEAPVAADPERGQLTALQLAVNRRRMNPEVVRQFPHGHYPAAVCIHFIDLPDYLIRGRALLPGVGAVDFQGSVAGEVDVEARAREQVDRVRMTIFTTACASPVLSRLPEYWACAPSYSLAERMPNRSPNRLGRSIYGSGRRSNKPTYAAVLRVTPENLPCGGLVRGGS